MPHDMIDEYFDIYNKSIKQYGEKTCVLYACGSFYEVYKIENAKECIGNADKIAEIIRCDFSNKNKLKRSESGSSRAFPDFCGFGTAYLQKYLTPLLENNYTVVVVDQLEGSGEKRGKLVKRGVVAVHSPCLKSPDLETLGDSENSLVGITFEFTRSRSVNRNDVFVYSICSINNTTNQIDIIEVVGEIESRQNFRTCIDDVHKTLSKYNTREMRIWIIDDINETTNQNTNQNTTGKGDYTKQLVKAFDEQSSVKNFTYRVETIYTNSPSTSNSSSYAKYIQYMRTKYQNEYFRRVYSHVDFGLVDPVEYLGLHDKVIGCVNFMFLLDFVGKHDLRYITNLSIPKITNETSELVLELDTLQQLHILPNRRQSNNKITSVFDVVDWTTTAVGRRHLKSILAKPFRETSEICFKYDLSAAIGELSGENFKWLEKSLVNVIDFDRLHRKMGLAALHPYEFEKLADTYLLFTELCSRMGEILVDDKIRERLLPPREILIMLSEYIQDYQRTFDTMCMRRIGLNTPREDFLNFFNTGVVPQLDKITDDIRSIEREIEDLRVRFDNVINETTVPRSNNTPLNANSRPAMIKLGFTDNDGYFFTCTKIRYQKLLRDCKDTTFNMRQTSNMCKFSTDHLTKLSDRLTTTRNLLTQRVKMHYLERMQNYYKQYNQVFLAITSFIEQIDVALSNIKCARKYNYCKPTIRANESGIGANANENENANDAFVIAERMRHPIIELVNTDTEYIPNDVTLGGQSDTRGVVLYGLNSSGKSSLLRSLGVCVVLAQAGLYVPCKSFTYRPFHTLISQVDLTDNLFANRSSFTSEMCGLDKILACSGPHTLVLSDELCRGTEINSSCAIVATTLLHLVQTGTKFFFTTHLHNLISVESISQNQHIQICHLNVHTRDDGTIIFERNLLPGSGSELYGLEVCKSIIKLDNFIDKAFTIRNQLTSNKPCVIDTGRSRYNKRKIVDRCEVCGHKPKRGEVPLDTHHINEQRDCDERGFVNDKHFHKNQMFNLVSLCKGCHQKIDTGELVIRGYVQSTRGVILDYTITH